MKPPFNIQKANIIFNKIVTNKKNHSTHLLSYPTWVETPVIPGWEKKYNKVQREILQKYDLFKYDISPVLGLA